MVAWSGEEPREYTKPHRMRKRTAHKSRRRKRKYIGGKLGGVYAKRNQILKEMGFESYSEYLKSPLYQSIRSRAFNEHGGECEACESPANGIHHTDYREETLRGTDLSALVPLCSKCHGVIEVTKSGGKRPLQVANDLLEKMCLEKLERAQVYQ